MNALAEGEAVELTGTTQLLGDPLSAPLTGEPCLAHRSRARVFTRLDLAGELIENLDLVEAAPFILETTSGSVFIVDQPAVIDLELSDLAWVEEHRSLAYLTTRGLDAYLRSSFFEHALILVGERLTVSGVITREPDPVLETGFRELQTRTRLTGYSKHPLTLRRPR